MTSSKIPVNRHLVGLVALACLVTGLVLLGIYGFDHLPAAACIRVGLLLGAFWLALGSRRTAFSGLTVRPTTLAGLILAILLVVWRPKALVPLILVIGLLSVLLRPRRKRRPNSTSE